MYQKTDECLLREAIHALRATGGHYFLIQDLELRWEQLVSENPHVGLVAGSSAPPPTKEWREKERKLYSRIAKLRRQLWSATRKDEGVQS